VLDIKVFDMSTADINSKLECYRFVDGIYDMRHRCGELGSYVTREISEVKKQIVLLPNFRFLYYCILYMMLYLFLYKFQYSMNNDTILLSWYFFIEYLRPIIERMSINIDQFNRDVKDLYNQPDDELWYTCKIYHYMHNNLSGWFKFRRAVLYTKFEEYFFFLQSLYFDKIRKSYRKNIFHRRFKGLSKLYKYGYYGFESKTYARIRRLVKLRGTIVSIVALKRFHLKRLRFRGFSRFQSLIYWAEIDEVLGDKYDSLFNLKFYNYLLNNQCLRDDRYLKEEKYYYKVYITCNFIYCEYLNYLYKKESLLTREIRKNIRECTHNNFRYYYKIENRIRDPRDFFNPLLDLKPFYKKRYNNYINTCAGEVYNKSKYDTYSEFDASVLMSVVDCISNMSVLSKSVFENLFTWCNYYIDIQSENFEPVNYYSDIIYNSSRLINNSISINQLVFNACLGSIILNFDPFYSRMEMYINSDTSYLYNYANNYEEHYEDYYYEMSMLNYFRVNILRCINFINYNKINLSKVYIGHKESNLNNSFSFYYNFYLHINNMYYDEIFNTIWYVPTIKALIKYCYKKYVIRHLSFSIMYLLNSKMSLNRYLFYIINFIAMSRRMYVKDDFKLSMFYNLCYYFFELHVSNSFVLSKWIGYWFSFFIGIHYNIPINYINLNIMLYSINTLNESCELRYNSYCYFKKLRLSMLKDFISFKYNSTLLSIIRIRMRMFYDRYYDDNIICLYTNNYFYYKYIIYNYNMISLLRLLNKRGNNLSIVVILLLFYSKLLDRVRYIYIFINNFIHNNIYLNFFKISVRSNNISIFRYLYYYQNIKSNIKLFKMFMKSRDKYFNIKNTINYNIVYIFNNKIGKRKMRKRKEILEFYKKNYNEYLNEMHLNTLMCYIPYYYRYVFLLHNYNNIRYYYNCLSNFYNKIVIYKSSIDFNINDFFSGISHLLNWGLYNAGPGTYLLVNSLSLCKSAKYNRIINSYTYEDSISSGDYLNFEFTRQDYYNMYEPGPVCIRQYNLKKWLFYHYIVRVDIRRYYSKFWYRYVPEDIIPIQRYRRFQQEIRRIIGNRKCIRSGIIYRRLLLFKLVPGVYKEWHRLHVRRPFNREQFEDRVRFFYILKYKYKISRKRLLSSLYNRFSSSYTLHRSYHLLYFRLDNILYKLSFIPTFTYLRDNWLTQYWNISINNIHDVSYIQRSLIIGDIFYIKNILHISAVSFRLSLHFEMNMYLFYLLWLRLEFRDGLPSYASLPTISLHINILRIYLWYWYRLFKYRCSSHYQYYKMKVGLFNLRIVIFGFWSHNYLMYKRFKLYMLINSLDYYVRWSFKLLCGFVYREPVGFLNGMHYSAYQRSESGSFGGHLRFTNIYK